MSELEHEAGILRTENLKLRNEVARLSQQTQHSQPQLTIPKSIADLADKEAFADSHTKFKIFIERYELNRLDRHLNLYCCTEEGRETVFAYMNPSTHDLVKVV